MKRRELFWMIAPCLLLAGAGAYFTRRANEPLRLVVTEAVLLPATPREVAEGWDAKVRLKYHLSGIFPYDPGKLNRSFPVECRLINPKTAQVWKNTKGFSKSNSITSFTESSFLRRAQVQESHVQHLKIRQMPKLAEPLELHLTVRGEIRDSPPSTNFWPPAYRGGHKLTTPVPLRFTLRPAPPSFTQPLSKERPFTIVGFRNGWWNSPTGQVPTAEVVVKPHHLKPDDEGRYYFHLTNIRFVINGFEIEGYPDRVESYSTRVPPEEISINAQISDYWLDNTKGLPPMKNITLKADLSIANCWPLPISVDLRKNGKNIERLPMPIR